MSQFWTAYLATLATVQVVLLAYFTRNQTRKQQTPAAIEEGRC